MSFNMSVDVNKYIYDVSNKVDVNNKNSSYCDINLIEIYIINVGVSI